MKPDITPEIIFQTARSGGKGGQNVNKVETMVEGRWLVHASARFNDEQKALLSEKLYHRITGDGYLLVKSQTHRSQMANKEEVITKMHRLIEQALEKKKARIATRPGRAAKEKRIETKKQASARKENRRKIRPGSY